MKTRMIMLLLTVAALFVSTLEARPGGNGRRGGGALIVALADADGDGVTTAAEFEGLLAAIDANGDGILDAGELDDIFVRPGFDRDGDGLLEVEDLRQLFVDLDANGDGEVTRDELPRISGERRRFASRLVARLADADEDRQVTGAEWQALLAGLDADADGVITQDEWFALLTEREPSAERFERLVRVLDRNDNAVLETSDLEAIFDELDSDASGVIEEDEWRRGGRR